MKFFQLFYEILCHFVYLEGINFVKKINSILEEFICGDLVLIRCDIVLLLSVYLLGLVERDTNTLLLFPVLDRKKTTLLPIICQYVEKGATIHTDGWASYTELNQNGFYHFSVIHKDRFKTFYKDMTTGEVIEVMRILFWV